VEVELREDGDVGEHDQDDDLTNVRFQESVSAIHPVAIKHVLVLYFILSKIAFVKMGCPFLTSPPGVKLSPRGEVVPQG
jgi:hypothetical protein